jgi:hypothetical protein
MRLTTVQFVVRPRLSMISTILSAFDAGLGGGRCPPDTMDCVGSRMVTFFGIAGAEHKVAEDEATSAAARENAKNSFIFGRLTRRQPDSR